MAEKSRIKIDNVGYKFYEKSIIVDGITIFYNREPNERDAQQLSRLINLGKEKKAKEIRFMISNLLHSIDIRNVL